MLIASLRKPNGGATKMNEASIAAIQIWVRERYGLEIGRRTAEEVAILASAPERPGEADAFTVRGADSASGESRAVEVDLCEARRALPPPLAPGGPE